MFNGAFSLPKTLTDGGQPRVGEGGVLLTLQTEFPFCGFCRAESGVGGVQRGASQ